MRVRTSRIVDRTVKDENSVKDLKDSGEGFGLESVTYSEMCFGEVFGLELVLCFPGFS